MAYGAEQVWNWRISDIDKIGDTVTFTPVITAYKNQSSQNAVSVTNERLSDVVAPITSSVNSTNIDLATTTNYAPNSSGVGFYPSDSNGYMFGFVMATLSIYGYRTTNSAMTMYLEHHNGSTWNVIGQATYYVYARPQNYYDFSYISSQLAGGWVDTGSGYFGATSLYGSANVGIRGTSYNANSEMITVVGMFPGVTSNVIRYLRVRVTNGSAWTYGRINRVDINYTLIPRHTHTLQQSGLGSSNQVQSDQVDNVAISSTSPPSSVEIKVNSGSWESVNNNTASSNRKSDLTTGNNVIYVRATTKCNVGITANYLAYGEA